jgi:hypothetical protein
MRYLFVLVMLAGCATHEEQRAETIARIDKHCSTLGFKPDTPEFRDCRLRMYAPR